MAEVVHRNNQIEPQPKSGKGNDQSSRDNNHVNPNKRLRTGASPLEGKTRHHPIDIGDSQDMEMGDSSPIHSASNDELFTDTGQARAALKHLGIGAPRPAKPLAKQKDETRTGCPSNLPEIHETPNEIKLAESPNELFQEVDIKEAHPSLFTREAAVRRRTRTGLSSPVRHKNSLPRDKQEVQSLIRNGNQPSRINPAARLNGHHVSHKGSDLEPESPDPIQQDDSTVKGTVDRRLGAMDRKTGIQLAADCIKGDPNSTKIRHFELQTVLRETSSDLHTCDIKRLGYDGLPDLAGRYVFVVNRSDHTYFLEHKDPLLEDSGPLTSPAPLDSISRITHGHSGGIIFFRNRHLHGHSNNSNLAFELASEKRAIDLVNHIQSLEAGIEMKNDTQEQMQKMLNTRVKEAASMKLARTPAAAPSLPQRQARPTVKSPHFASSAAGRDKGVVATPSSRLSTKTIITVRDRQPPELTEQRNKTSAATRDDDASEGPQPQLKSDVHEAMPTKTRNLRSTPQTLVAELRSRSPKLKHSQTGALGPEWKTPLVYPPSGKQRETVHFSDLERLDDDEFLNDSLVALFSKYLQHSLEARNDSLLKKMHFFNTYLYESLSRGTKSRKEINYNNVKRWTAKINIFSRDFVVVPVNENLHWFVAIICNLPYFRNRSQKPQDDVEDIIEVDDDDYAQLANERVQSSETANDTQRSFEELSLDEKIQANDIHGDRFLAQNRSTPKARGRKKKSRPSLQKYETDRPIIITLDSLGLARSSTVAALKQYLVQEARDKQGWDIDIGELKGMTAKSIPTQGNYSDCGLYMCMYLEQFMTDPYGFVEKILRREESRIRWPKDIDSTILRSRMRDLILGLHQRQENETPKMEIPEVGSILVNMRGPTPEPEIQELLLQDSADRPSSSSSVKDIRASKQRYIQITRRMSEDARTAENGESLPASHTPKPRKQHQINEFGGDAVPANANNPIMIDESPRRSRKGLSSRPPSSSSTLKPTSKRMYKGSADLAQQIRNSQSPSKPQYRADGPSSRQKSVRADHSDNESVTTDYLGGNKSYPPTPENVDGVRYQSDHEFVDNDIQDSKDELTAEVAGTQETDDEIEDSQLEVQQLGASSRAEEEEMLLDQHDRIT